MPELQSRDIIYPLLEANEAELLLRAAFLDGDAATFDGDVFRALMQTSLGAGDLETVRATSERLIEVGLSRGNLMLALEGICLLRNVGGEVDKETKRVLDALDKRGFSETDTLHAEAWQPDLDAARKETTEFPPPATALALLSERVLKPTKTPFGWVTLWPALTRETRAAVIERLHFEMRQPDDPALQPPRIVVAWVISGELRVHEQSIPVLAGSMLTHRTEAGALRGGRHLRMIGLRHEHWEDLMLRPDFRRAWELSQRRALISDAVYGLASAHKLPEDAIEALIQHARIARPGKATESQANRHIMLVLEKELELSIQGKGGAEKRVVRPSDLVVIPAGVALEALGTSVIRWDEATFTQHCSTPLDSLLQVAGA